MHTQKKSGFSLIELLVVIVIIGILAMLSLRAFDEIIGQARDSKVQADVQNIYTFVVSAQTNEWSDDKYVTTNGAVISNIAKKGGVDIENGGVYLYGYKKGSGANDNEFFVAGWNETDESVIVKGTNDAIEDAEGAFINYTTFANANNFDSYIIFKIKDGDSTCQDLNKGFCKSVDDCTWNSTTDTCSK